jgi:Tol biopolymer transport system component
MTVVGEAFPVAQDVERGAFAGSASGALSFIAGARQVSRLVWFTRDGKTAGVAAPEGDYSEVAISRGGRFLGFSRADSADGNVDVWVQPLSGGAPSRLTSDPDIDHLLAISPDERDVVWESHAKGSLNLMRRPLDGSSPAQLVRAWGKSGGPTDWSLDGQAVLYQSDDGSSGNNLWLVPAGGSGDPARLTPPGLGVAEGQFSPDGRLLAFTAEATGKDEVYVQRMLGMKLEGGPVRVSESGGRWPQWRRDGAELFFISSGTVMAAELRAGRLVGSPRSLFTIAGSSGIRIHRNFAATPDGQRFIAIVSGDQPANPATVMLNWRAGLDSRP